MPKYRVSRAFRAAVAGSMIVACGSAEDFAGGELPATPSLDTFTSSFDGSDGDASTTEGETGPRSRRGPPDSGAPARVYRRGVNLAGAEFGTAIPGKEGVDYVIPTTAEVDYYLGKGMNTFRLGFKWERLQRSARGALDAAYLGKLDAIVAYATSKGATVILNPHNFARYYGTPVGSASVPSSVFADLWSKLASKYKDNPAVVFNLVNEPHDMPTEQWVSAANAAIAAIRATGATNEIQVPGNSWTGAHSWYGTGYGTPNAVAMLDIVDPIDNLVFEVHQYLDANSGGQSDTCVSTTIGVERLQKFVGWLREHGKRGFVGEFAGGRNQRCYDAIANMVEYMEESDDVLDGWLWWAGGPGWGEYAFTLEPKNGVDRPQMAVLLPYLGN